MRKMLIKVTLQSTLIEKQLILIKKPPPTITVSNQQINQRHTDDIETTISNTINNAELPRNDNRIIETSKKYGTEDNNDQEKR